MLINFLTVLLLTIITEAIVAILIGFRTKDEILAVVCINLITNPALNYFLVVNDYFHFAKMDTTFILLLEASVVLIEWRLLVFAFRKNRKELFILSLMMNISSYALGLLLFG